MSNSAVKKEETKIRKIRRDIGIPITEVARRVGVSHTAVQKWDYGKAFPRKEHLIKLAKVLRCSVADFY